ncbi:hypothetical protein HYH03_002062 [Edaphochlamys debaryana]|uniref:Uncharacterized protein n=1 Tax=Edaphochlamys debaryana TaxID=47281 RepID=A0A836C4E6_9CHLO|nr:hypothetical protein HYH03_002062 [Edaphochlamys debaryana]|eukprot:KAG2499765.1 hypothetical protein HYH03_002062 [Edaphochlamys debaryana]
MYKAVWDVNFAPEVWVGVVRRVNRTVVEFTDGTAVPPIDGLPADQVITIVEPACLTDVRGCCGSLTSRIVGPYLGPAGSSRGPRLLLRSCLNISLQYVCRGPLPPSPPPPSPPARPMSALVELRFRLDYLALSSQQGRVEALRAAVLQRVAAEYDAAAADGGRKASVRDVFHDTSDGTAVVRVLVPLPLSVAEASVAAYLFRLLNQPSAVFEPAFRAEFGIAVPITAQLLATVDPNAPPPAGFQPQSSSDGGGDSDSSQAGLIAGLCTGLGLALFIGLGVAWWALARRRAANKKIHEIH